MRVAFLVLGAASLAACSMDPPLPQTPLPVPQSWPVGDPYLLQSEAALPELAYGDVFGDPRLLALIDQALANNRDLKAAAANISAARAQAAISRAGRLPEVAATGGVSVGDNGQGGTRTNLDLGLGVPAFEVDLFGRLASLARADQERLLSTEAGARAVRLALIADIARAWATYAADGSLLAIAERTAANAERSVGLTEARLRGGIVPKTDLLQARQILETAKSDLAEQRTAVAQDLNLLQLLVGATLDHALLPGSIDEIDQSFTAPPAGLDSRILLRRPDIVEAEYRLRAANAEIGAARAALFPTISLTGLLGLASDALGGLFSGGFTWSAGADARYSIFNAGAGRARVRVTEAQRDAALAAYEKAIQTGFREVADALAERGAIGERLRSAEAQVAATSEAARLVDARYREGIDPYLATLDAQRSFYAAQRAQVLVQLAEMQNVATLYQTIGGT
jgi:multidrug efflux system outer membrane protein